MSAVISPWTTSVWPTSTTLSSINPTKTSDLVASVTSATARIATETYKPNLISLSRVIRGAAATQAIVSAEEILSTATNSAIQAQATQIIFENTVNLQELAKEENLYRYDLSRPGNIIYLVVFGVLFFYYLLMYIKSRYHWFNITFICGYALEFAGFIGRCLSFKDPSKEPFYLLQFVGLTIAPAFIMAGVYFTFAQLVVIHGRQYSVLKPMWYTYFFITFDVVSLFVQAAGGGIASKKITKSEDPAIGNHVMVVGIAVQIVSMTVFLIFWFEFLNRLYFKDSHQVSTDDKLNKRSVGNYVKMLLNTNNARAYKSNHLDSFYEPQYYDIRMRKLVGFYPLAITIGVLFVYIRCIYRVVELAQGWRGYLITHEVFLMVLDAFMIGVCGIIFVFFHPYLVFGKSDQLKVSAVRNGAGARIGAGTRNGAVDRLTDESRVPNEKDSL